MLEVVDVTAGYGDLVVLRNVHILLNDGEIVAIVGSNGSGKSTLLRVISCFLPTLNGQVVYLGEKISGMTSHHVVNKGIVQVPESRQLFPRMTVQENLLIGAYPRAARKFRNDNLQKAYRLFPILEKRVKQSAGSLSGGEQQMLAIGRSIMACPKVLMLDEPSLGLAPIMVDHIFQAVSNIRDEENASILIVEQNVYESLSLSDRGYVLENGQISMEGSSRALLNDQRIKTAYLGI